MQKYIEINNSIINEILNHISKNSFLKDYYLILMDEIQIKELNFLQRKIISLNQREMISKIWP